jgi:quercetin dioxygenase-like cupin family protein
MAYRGQVLTNPVSGETLAFRQTSADTDGEYLEIDLYLSEDGHVPGAHVHPSQEERFEVVEGRLRIKLGFKTIVAEAGDTVVVPAGARHKFKAASENVHARVTVTPALQMEALFEKTVELAEQGRTTRKGMPKPLDLALFVEQFEAEVRAPFPPPAIVRLTMAPLRALARRRDRRAKPLTPQVA